MSESVAGIVCSVASSVEMHLQVMAQKGSSLSGISSHKDDLDAISNSIDNLELLVISTVKK